MNWGIIRGLKAQLRPFSDVIRWNDTAPSRCTSSLVGNGTGNGNGKKEFWWERSRRKQSRERNPVKGKEGNCRGNLGVRTTRLPPPGGRKGRAVPLSSPFGTCFFCLCCLRRLRLEWSLPVRVPGGVLRRGTPQCAWGLPLPFSLPLHVSLSSSICWRRLDPLWRLFTKDIFGGRFCFSFTSSFLVLFYRNTVEGSPVGGGTSRFS